MIGASFLLTVGLPAEAWTAPQRSSIFSYGALPVEAVSSLDVCISMPEHARFLSLPPACLHAVQFGIYRGVRAF